MGSKIKWNTSWYRRVTRRRARWRDDEDVLLSMVLDAGLQDSPLLVGNLHVINSEIRVRGGQEDGVGHELVIQEIYFRKAFFMTEP